MRDFSKVSPSLHNSERFRALGRDYVAKLVYQYLITCPHGNSTGCFALKDGYACDDLDMEIEEYLRAMEALTKVGLIAYDRATKVVLIAKWLDHNPPTNLKHAMGMLSIIKKLGDSALVQRCYAEFAAVLRAKHLDRDSGIRTSMIALSDGYAKGIATLVDQTRPDQDQTLVDQTETREEGSRPAHRVPATLTGGTLAPVVVDDQPAAPSPSPIGMPRPLSAAEQGAASRLLSTTTMRRAS